MAATLREELAGGLRFVDAAAGALVVGTAGIEVERRTATLRRYSRVTTAVMLGAASA